MPSASVIPNRVQRVREERGWTKAKLAREAEIAIQTLNRIENGEPTRKDRRIAVAKALGQSYSQLFPSDQ